MKRESWKVYNPTTGRMVTTSNVIFDDNVGNKEVLVSRRAQIDNRGTIISQGGRVESFESFEEAAVREAKEEAGITINIGDLKLVYEKVINGQKFKNYYVLVNNRPIVNGPEPQHEFELQDVIEILPGIPTLHNDTGKNLRLAWVPIIRILPPANPRVPRVPRAPFGRRVRAAPLPPPPRPNPIEDTLFTKILQKIELVIG